MTGDKEKFKAQMLKKTLMDIEVLIISQKKKISIEKDLMKLNHLNTEFKIMQEVRDQKLRESGRHISKIAKPSQKTDLKSYDDYIKSKGK